MAITQTQQPHRILTPAKLAEKYATSNHSKITATAKHGIVRAITRFRDQECQRKTMAYTCAIGNGQQLAFNNIGRQTTIVYERCQSGQQAQASTSTTTGSWSQAPQVFRTSHSIYIRFVTVEQGEVFFQLQDNHLQQLNHIPVAQAVETVPIVPINTTG
jgi:hypothetical protein